LAGDKDMSRKLRTWIIVIAIVIVIAVLYGLTYIPHRLITIKAENVSSIYIFNGNTGKDIRITDKADIEHIITNLNNVIFNKGKCSIGYMGYSFRTIIYKENGKQYKQFIINSTDTVRYGGFFYTDKANSIDYGYISDLFNK
jgi:hypothetical protein